MPYYTTLYYTSRHRNNLYWCSSLETPVLWMGTTSDDPNGLVDVLAITRTSQTASKDKDKDKVKEKEKEKGSIDINQSSAPSSSTSSSSSSSKVLHHKEHSQALASPTPHASASPSPLFGYTPLPCPNHRRVVRNTLRPMDDDILQLYKDMVGRELVGALLDFAEWDDHARQSFMWPIFIIQILG